MPDLSELFRSQPGWVVVAVILIIAAAYVLRPVLAGRYGQDDDDDEPEAQAVGAHEAPAPAQAQAPTGGPGRTYDAILDALDRLREVAREQGARGDNAERERDALAAQLDRAIADLADCERRAVDPVRDAHRYANRQGIPPAEPRRRRHRLDPDTDPRVRRAPRDDRAG